MDTTFATAAQVRQKRAGQPATDHVRDALAGTTTGDRSRLGATAATASRGRYRKPKRRLIAARSGRSA
ncbi:MAG TPA: hypothetical protein VIP77_18765 [Jiangellaceae bacterium]